MSFQDKLLKTQGHFTTDLVSLDFKSDSLQKFLQNVVTVVNQHSLKLNNLQTQKLSVQPALDSNLKLSNTIAFTSPLLVNSVQPKVTPQTDDPYADSTSQFVAKLATVSQAIDLICRKNEERDMKLQAIDKKFQEMVKSDQMRQRLKRNKDEGISYTNDEINKLLIRLKDLENKTNKKLGDFQNLTKQVEKKTLWKITECEQSLSKKITPEYVEKAIEQMEQRILRDIKNGKNSESNELRFQLDGLSKNFEAFKKDIEQKHKTNKKTIAQLVEQCKGFDHRDKLETDRAELELKIKELNFKVDRLQRREDPQDVEIRMTKIMTENSEKLADVNKRLKHIEEEFESQAEMLSKVGGEGGFNDPHKICQMDAEIKRLKDSNRTNEAKISSLDEELKTKLLIFEERISSSLAMMRNQENNVSRQELYESIGRLREPLNQRVNQNNLLLNELSAKMQKMELFQKATKRKIKDLSKGDELNKILQMKMNTSDGKLLIDSLGMKLENMEVYYNKLRMEVDANSTFLREIHDKMGGVEEGFSVISSKPKIFPAKCLTCGVKHVPHKSPGEMMGSDGKFYRVDVKGACIYDSDEVFDVVPSQIAMMQSGIKRDVRVSSAKGRKDDFMSTGHTKFRPQSAKKL